MNNDDKAVLLVIDGFHKALHGTTEVREAITSHTVAARILRDVGNSILMLSGEDPVPLYEERNNETSLPAFVALHDLNEWVLWQEPEEHYKTFAEKTLPAMMTDPEMGTPEAAGLFLILAGKASQRLWEAMEEHDAVGISTDDLERLDEALIAFADSHGLSGEYMAS